MRTLGTRSTYNGGFKHASPTAVKTDEPVDMAFAHMVVGAIHPYKRGRVEGLKFRDVCYTVHLPAFCWWPSIRPRRPKWVCTWTLWATAVGRALPTCRSRTWWPAESSWRPGRPSPSNYRASAAAAWRVDR